MTFLQFLGYFLLSTFVLECLKIGIRFLIVKRQHKKMQQSFEEQIKNGTIKAVSMDQLVDELKKAAGEQEETKTKGKKTWH